MLVACLSLLVPLPAAIPAIVCVFVLGIWIIFGCFWYLESRLYLFFGIGAVFGNLGICNWYLGSMVYLVFELDIWYQMLYLVFVRVCLL